MKSFYIKPEIKKMLDNIDAVPCRKINGSNYFSITEQDVAYLLKLIKRLDKLPFEDLTTEEKWKYSSYLNNAERLVKHSCYTYLLNV